MPGPWFQALPPIAQAALAGALTWLLTALGAAVVCTRQRLGAKALDAMLGFAAGVMLAASIWSLLAPALRLAAAGAGGGRGAPLVGFLAGLLVLRGVDRLLPHLHADVGGGHLEGVRTSWRRSTLLLTAITLHHIPEGLALGVAFGAAALPRGLADGASLSAALALTLGLGVQNIPEGMAVAMPLRREGMSPLRSFGLGQLSAAIEPFAAAVGAAAVLVIGGLLPYALGFAAGAMIYVIAEALLPEVRGSGHSDTATLATGIGFAFMTALSLWLG